jgi:hypothetical protein
MRSPSTPSATGFASLPLGLPLAELRHYLEYLSLDSPHLELFECKRWGLIILVSPMSYTKLPKMSGQ